MDRNSRLYCLGCDALASAACIDGGHSLVGMEAYGRLLQCKEAVSALREEARAAMDKYQAGHQLEQELQLMNCQEPVAIVCDTWTAQAVHLQQQPVLQIAMLLLLQQGHLQQHQGQQQQYHHDQQQQQQQQQNQQEQRQQDQRQQEQQKLLQHDQLQKRPKEEQLEKQEKQDHQNQDHQKQNHQKQNHQKQNHQKQNHQEQNHQKQDHENEDAKKLQALRQQQYQKLLELKEQKRQQEEEKLRTSPNQLDLYELSQSPEQEWQEEKAQVLQRCTAQAVTGLHGQMDPAWVLQVLRRLGPSLQELQLRAASREHLLELQRLPQLRRLELQGCQQDVQADPALPGPWRALQLEWLLLADLPRHTLQDLVAALATSLQELELFVGTPPEAGEEEDWPWSCSDLRGILQQCGLRRLRSLRLLRWLQHSRSLCAAQLAALRSALPGCTVACSRCSS